MNKLLIVVPLVLAACSSGHQSRLDALIPNLYIATPEGAGLGPYTVAEYNARVADRQPGLVRLQEPWTRADARRQNRGRAVKGGAVVKSSDPVVATGPVLTGPRNAAEARALATTTPTTYRLDNRTLVTVVLLPDGRIKETIRVATPST